MIRREVKNEIGDSLFKSLCHLLKNLNFILKAMGALNCLKENHVQISMMSHPV